LIVVEEGAAGGVGVADEGDSVRSRLGDVAAANDDAAIVIINENRVPTELIQEAILDGTIFRAVEEEGAAAIDRPVGAKERFPRFHEGAEGLAEGDSFQGDKFDRRLFVALEFDQVLQSDGLDGGFAQVEPLRGIEIEGVGFGVEKPFAGRIEFLKNIFHEPVFFVNALRFPDKLSVRPGRAVVLPAAFEHELSIRGFARDDVRKIAPERGVHGVKKTSGGIAPGRDPFRADGIGGAAVEDELAGVVVRITGQNLPLAIHEQLIGLQIGGNRGLHDAVLIRFPVEIFKFAAAADDRLFLLVSLVNDRCLLRSRIVCCENQGRLQVIDPLTQIHRHGARCLRHPRQFLRVTQGQDRVIDRTRILIVA
jgi:hypothetical protein